MMKRNLQELLLRKAKKIDTKKKSLKLSLDNGPKTQVYSEETNNL